MNKRIKKKKFKQYHKQFRHLSIAYEEGYSKQKYEAYQCPKCGWDALDADEDISLGEILWSCGGFYDYSFEVEYKCPCCRSVFSYVDGS